MGKVKIFIILLISILIGCKSTKIQFQNFENIDFCKIEKELIDTLKSDEKLKKYFGFEEKEAKFHVDTLVQKGVIFSFFNDPIREMRMEKKEMSFDEAYSEMQDEALANSNKKYAANCFENNLSRRNADLNVEFFYLKKDDLIVIEVTNILKQPGYTIGYIYFFEIKKNGKLEKIKDTYWQE